MSSCPRKKGILLLSTLIYISSLLITTVGPVISYAKDECKDLEDTSKRTECYEEKENEVQRKLDETQNKLSGVQDTIGNLSSDLGVATQQIIQTQASINEVRAELEAINETLNDLKGKLEDKINFRNKLVRNYSKKSALSDFELFLTSPDTQITTDGELANLTGFQYSIFVYAFNKATNEETIKIITSLNSEIRGYEEDKKQAEDIKDALEIAEQSLVALKADLDIKKAQAEKEAAELAAKKEEYKEELNELQDKIIALKGGEGTISGYEAPEYKLPSSPFKPAFAAMSYGAYTHYNGLSQYGARGRAEEGQNYEKILEFYYHTGVDEKNGLDDDEICVQGQGNMKMGRYLRGLGEMPPSWDEEALKAQAVAARTYAYRYTKNGSCICTTTNCQYFHSDLVDRDDRERWYKAIKDTENEILDGDVSAQYSSTTGGYINNIGWDTKCKGSSCWPGDAYEKKGKSPWFYKAWNTETYKDNSGTCGRSTPWLKENEMADIVNAYMVYTKGSDGEKGHISPLTTDCWGGEPYSIDEMRAKADKYGGAYEKVYSIDVDISNGGYTSQVKVTTNNGSVNMDGQTFKTVFNLRAPAFISIRSRLFDFEKED